MNQRRHQRQLTWLRALAAVAAIAFLQTAWAGPGVSYQVLPAKVVSESGMTEITLMVEQPSGRTWMLSQQGGGSPTWQPLSYGEGQGLTTATIPRPAPYEPQD
ncbi:hypothetical protein [Thiohalobacter thiocyanaticus]|uniref:hypothetical protein n=1 Tax=Thiohalobacter thiocyanaticus TaxID=585455 RepID=UPI000F632624|nr:hypothetical protein [Thiohalobacter thiocyanaticus]